MAEMAGRRLLFVVNDTAFFVSHRLPVAVAAREAGFEIDLAALDAGGLEQVRAHGIVYHPLAVDRTGINPLRDFRLLCQLIRLIKTLRPSVVHTVTIKPVLYGGIAARLLEVPSLVSAVSGLGAVFLGGDRKTSLVRSLVRTLYRLALAHRNSCAIFQNPDDLRHMVDAGLVAGDHAVLIRGSGVDVSVFQPSPPPPGPPIVIMPARLVWYKGVSDFVEAAGLLRQAGVAIRMALVGEPPAHNRVSVPRSQLEAWVAQGVVEWWGYQPDMPRVYAGSHIVCLPSFYGEGIPRALLEAAACARPIVTTDIPGCREAVHDRENGLLVAPRAPQALADALRALAEDPGLRLAMGRRGRERAVAEFSLDRVVAATLAVYQRLSATAVS
ncbi:MAG: glycosyl transferase family 1 [Geminicoccaceae bacterium]|jgi:glycosyltransferase involved in cell wall biosynthesis|nr:glycosyl transferase family 1 [Geminicoccaceae bacterium]MCE3249240.1 glycosyl transferase family 1 [Geminicoccaceae bacterium]